MKLQDEKFIKETGEFLREEQNRCYRNGLLAGFFLATMVALMTMLVLS